MKRPTVGKIATDLAQKKPDTLSPIEQMQEQLTDYDKNIMECIATNKKQFTNTDFYVVVITKKEPLLQNVIRHYFTGRLSCPTPDYDQTLYKYFHADDRLDFLWVIPSKDTCQMLLSHAHEIIPEEWALLRYVTQFADGTLFKMAKNMNGERDDSVLLASN
jgi:hypothetical protein